VNDVTGSNDLAVRLAETADIFERLFGVPVWTPKKPLDELILTVLSQNTNDRNRDLAYNRLRNAFPGGWEEVLNGDLSRIEETIRPAGLSNQKSVRIQQILRWINEQQGSLSLEFLRNLSDDEIITLLTGLKGIGVKTAAVLATFSLGRDLCPVDTHVHRISL